MKHCMSWLKRALPAVTFAAFCGASAITLGGCALAALPMIAPSAGVALGNALAEKPKTQLVAMQVTVDQPTDNQLKCPALETEKLKMAEVIANAGVIEVPINPPGTDTKSAITNTALDVGTETAKNVAVSSMGPLGGIGAGVAGGMKQQSAQAQAQTEKLNEMRLRIQANQAVNDAQKRTEKLAKLQKQHKCT